MSIEYYEKLVKELQAFLTPQGWVFNPTGDVKKDANTLIRMIRHT